MKKIHILGLNAYHGDSAACLVTDGKLVAAAAEERFRRIKHWAGFPLEAIRFCLREARLNIQDIDHIAVNRNPKANFIRKLGFAISHQPHPQTILLRGKNSIKIWKLPEVLAQELKTPLSRIRARFHFVEHHQAHLASAFFVSPYKSAALLSIDSFGDFVSTMQGLGNDTQLHILSKIFFPHSLGHFYLSLTQHLGFRQYGDEYKLMGLASYGKATELNKMKQLVRLLDRGSFELNLKFFSIHKKGTAMSWDNEAPHIDDGYSKDLTDLLGPSRKPGEPITSYHKNLAASVQRTYENAFFHILNELHHKTGQTRLCLAGGCALNGVANGLIPKKTPFRHVYVAAAPADDGGALGAAFFVRNQLLKDMRVFNMNHAFTGSEFSMGEIKDAIDSKTNTLENEGIRIRVINSPRVLCQYTAEAISKGLVIGWFQGKMEWGPRALGNRSILCDPRRPDIKNILNSKIKRRESFRPFAPSILREKVQHWFERDDDVSFMSKVISIRPEKRAQIPAVTHIDGTGRLQTLSESQNPLFYMLIQAFEALTSVPILLNTSFNENEPMVCSPAQALDCFIRTKMDRLIIKNYVLERPPYD